MPVSARRLD